MNNRLPLHWGLALLWYVFVGGFTFAIAWVSIWAVVQYTPFVEWWFSAVLS